MAENKSIDLVKAALIKRGGSAAISPQAEEICKIIDHFNSQHWHDRDRYHERIKTLEAEIERLKTRNHPE